jgi:hypothetical protein
MPRKTFLFVVACAAAVIGLFALLAPGVLIGSVKHADVTPTALVMTRTVGVLLLTMGLLNFLVRRAPDSPTLRAVLWANLFLQVAILPIDPLAYVLGIYRTLDSFLPNTVLHILLITGFAYYLRQPKASESPASRSLT